ncbi:WD40 repeat domain-containing protein [Streptomyces sp. NPDC014802]|uniref:WD40 repeat domain-containing protein n=1 Tax=Streptomyces sp. NPDC014802 TaxID=3364917 RepID=UPI003701143F
MDRIIKWGAKAMPGTSVMAKGPVSEVLAGKRAPQTIDRLLWLVRALMAFEDGQEIAPPSRRDPALDTWRERWNSLQDARQIQRSSPDSPKNHPGAQPPRGGSIIQPLHMPRVQETFSANPGHASEEPDWPLAMRVLKARRNHNPIYLASIHCDDLIVAISFSTVDDLLMVALSDGDVLGWDLERLEVVHPFNLDTLNRRPGNVTHFVFSENGRRFTCTRMGDPLTAWARTDQPGEYQPTKNLDAVPNIPGAPKAELLAIADNGTVLSGAASSGFQLSRPSSDEAVYVPVQGSYEQTRGKITALAISPDARMIAYAQGDRVVMTSTEDIAAHPTQFTPIFDAPCRTGQVNDLRFYQGGNVLACAGRTGVEILDFRDPRRLKQVVLGKENTHSVTFALDGHLACADLSGVSVFNLSDRRLTYRKEVSNVSAVTFSLDSSILAVARNREVELWS